MAICSFGISRLINNLIQDKPWFKFDNKNFIQVLTSPNGKINPQNYYSVAETFANGLNKAINKDVEIGKIFFPKQYSDGTGILIKMNNVQSEILNSLSEREEYDTTEEEARVIQQEDANRAGIEYSDDYLFALDMSNNSSEQLEFHINTLNVVSTFLENIGVETRLVPEFLNQDGSVIEGAIAAANFMKGTVDIIDDLNKGRAEAWNKLPEEAAHWWYRLLKQDSILKDKLKLLASTSEKYRNLRDSNYANYDFDAMTEETIGQLIAESIKRIETKNGSTADYSFFKKFLEWINSIIDIFRDTIKDPFEVAAMKILSSDMSDLLTWEEYSKLNNIVNFADVLTNQSIAPIDYTIMSRDNPLESGDVYIGNVNNEPEISYSFRDSLTYENNPYFNTKEEFEKWFVQSKYYDEYLVKQRNIIQEVRDNQKFFDRLLNKTFKKRSKFLPKTLRKYYTIIDAQNLNKLQDWSINQQLHKIVRKLSDKEKQQIINTNGYTNIAPTLKVLPEILKKYKKNPIVLNDTIKVDSAKKQELSILNNIKDMIKLENPNLKSITAEEFVNEVHNWLEINYLLGFANENVYLGYHIDQTFQHLENRFSNEASPLANMTEEEINRLPLAERQRIANVVGLTRQNPDVYHNKVSIRFNDMSHLKSGHFNDYGSPSAWGNLTYFYTGKNRLKDAVLLHEIQNDNIEFLKEYKAEKVDLETSLGNYLMQLNRDLLDNITQIESGGKRIQRYKNLSTTSDYSKQYVELNFKIQEFMDLPLELGLSSLKQYLNEQIELHKSVTTPEKIQEQLTKLYSQRRKFIDFQKRGGLKSLLNPNELKDLKEILVQLNTQEIEGESVFLHEENQWEPGYRGIRNLKKKKEDFSYLIKNTRELLNLRFKKMYGEDVPYINLIAPAKPLPKSQRRGRIVNIGTPREMRIGNASQQLNESVNFLLAFSEQNMSKEFSKSIEEYKKSYIHARNAKIKNIFNTNLSKINEEQYANLIENYKYNQVLLNKLIDEQARKDVKTQSVDITNLSDEEIIKDIEGEFEEPNEIDQFSGSTFRYKNMYLSLNATTKEEAVKEIRDRHNPITQKENEQYRFEVLKQKALAKKEELEKDYDKIDSEARQTLETELNYFTPLVHHLIQKHINQYGKDFPMYFSGYQVTLLTQGNTRTALIYAGKEEINTVDRNFFEFNGKKYKKLGEGAIINADTKEELRYFKHDNSYKLEDVNGVNVITEQEYNKGLQEYEKAYQQATEQRAKEIKVQAAKDIGITTDNIEFETNYKRMEKETFSGKLPENAEDFKNALKLINEFNLLKKERDEILLKKLNEYKKQSKQNLDRVVNTIMNLSGSKPIETGAIYNAMTQISGVKLIWKDKIEGLKGNTGGYLVDLSNYNYNTPILYGMQNKPIEKPLFALNLSPIDQTHQPDSKFSSIQLSSELQKIYRDLAVKHNYDLGLIFPELLKDNNVIFSRAYVNDQNEEVGTYHYNFETDPKFTGLGKDLEAAKTALLKDKQIIDIDNNSTKNIQITINDKIIFGHPTIGKSFLKHKSDNRFISLDDDYGKEVTDFVDANRGTLTRQEYKGSKPREYNEFMLSLYDIAKEKAFRENKQLFVSNTNILKERMSDFDKVISIPRDEFKRRFEERGATYGFDDWKSDIDATINKVNPNKVITTTGYLSDLLNENKGLEALNLKNVLYSAVFFNTNEITSKYKQVHPNLYSHHSTIEFKPADTSNLPIGETKSIKIVGRLTTNKVDALIVENDLSKNKFPHITLSTAEGVKPFASNSEIENNQDKIVKLDDTIIGKVGVFDGVNEITNTNSPLYALDLNQVNYQFKAINNISNNLAKVNTWYRQLKDTDEFWNKVQQDLQIPKEQIKLLRDSKGNNIEEKLANFAANYSYTVEIKIATKNPFSTTGMTKEELESKKYTEAKSPTSYYYNLTVPGGTNYTENEISTPGQLVEERPQGISTKQGVPELFESNPELSLIGTQEQYSQYLDTVFPDSKVKDIVYHGTNLDFDKFDKNRIGSNTAVKGEKPAFSFSNNKEQAEAYSSEITVGQNTNELAEAWFLENQHIFKNGDINTGIVDINNVFKHYKKELGDSKEMISPTKEIDPVTDKYKLVPVNDKTLKQLAEIKTKEWQKEYNTLLTVGARVMSVIIDVKNPKIVDFKGEKKSIKFKEEQKNTIGDAFIAKNIDDWGKGNTIQVFEPEQIHILGSKQDIEGFKSYIQNKQSVTPRQGISELFAENPQLTSIGTQEQYERYLSTIFPNSKVKDIVYHETSKYSKEKILQKGFNAPIEELLELGKDSLIWFSRQKNYYKTKNTVSIPAILNSISPKIDSHQNFERVGDASGIKKYNLEAVGADAIITEEYADEDLPPLRDLPEDFVNPIVFAAVIEPEQIHILGSKQDIQGFKKFIKDNTKYVRKNAITPSIKGHAQFSTDNGIGWFRSDDASLKYTQNEDEMHQQNIILSKTIKLVDNEDGTYGITTNLGPHYEGTNNEFSYREAQGIMQKLRSEATNPPLKPIKTRRILEVQSDLFQNIEPSKIWNIDKTKVIGYKVGHNKTLRQFNTLEEAVKYSNELKERMEGNKGSFIELLKKDNNWVTFFIKSIIQDSAKKGYEKVLFPQGPTANKIEKQGTLEDFIRNKESAIEKLEKVKQKRIDEVPYINDELIKTTQKLINKNIGNKEENIKNLNKYLKEKQEGVNTADLDNEINQLNKEIADAKAGKHKFAAIAKFYQKDIFNILKKQGFKPTEITDEYDNKWFEVDLTTEDAKQETVLFALNFSNPVHQEAEVLVQNNKALIDKTLLDIFFKFRENLNKSSDLISDRERKRIKAMFGNNFKQQDVEDELVKIESTALTFGHMIAEMQVIFKNYDQEARDTINSTTLTNTEKVNKLTSINAFVQSFDKILKTLAPVVPNTSNQLFKMLAEIRTYKDSILGLYLDYIGDYAVESVYDILEGDAKIQFDLLTDEITRQQALYDTLIAKGNTKAAGARKARIDQLNAQIKELLPSKEKIQAIRLGKAKDSTWIQKLIEAAGMSGNPIVATVRSIIGNADLVLKSRINSVRNRIEKTIDSLGVLPTQVQKAFGKMLEEIEFNDLREDGTIKTGNTLYLLHNIKAEIYSIHEKLLNANKQAQTKYYAELEKQRLELSKGIVSTETADKIKELKLELNKSKKDLKTFSDKNIVRQFKKEYYDLFELLKVDYTGVNSNGDTITTNIGDYEFLPGLSLNIILNERRNLYNTIDIQGGEVTEEQAELLQYYKVQLDYLAGTQNKLWQPKTGIDLLISEKYNEYKLARKEVFDESFLSKEAEASWLANRARISEDNLNTWDSVHSRTIYKQSYWDEFNDIVSRLNSTIDAIRQIMGDLDLEDSKKITELWKELTEKTKKYRQSNGEINVDLLIKDNTPEFVQELKELELSIDELKQQAESLFGLNKQQAEEVSSLYDLKSKLKVRRKNLRREQLKLQKDKVANAERLEEIKLELELNKNEKEAADVKIAEFEVIRKEKTANIKNKGAEQLYSDYKKILKELGEIRSKGTSLEYEEKVKQVKGEIETNTLTLNNQELIDFLKSNGITIENEKDTNSLRKQYNEYIYKNSDWFKQNHIKRSRLVKSQVDSSFMRITSDEPIYIWNITRPSDESSIEIVPSYGYFTSKVKEDFINEDYEEGRVKFIENSETRNDKYYDLAKTDPKMFQVLNILTNEYLEAQKNYDEPGKRIGYRYPTVVKTGQERTLSGEKFNNFKNNFTAAWKDMWSIDPNTIDELTDFGVNYERKTIPIMYSGLADESFLTRDVPKAIMMYIYGAEKYKAYKEVLPQVEAIQNSLVDTDKNVNTIDIVKETIKTLMYNNTISAKTKAGVITTKVVNNLTSLFSLKAFGLNIPPQVVNWLNGQINMWIMAGNTAGIIPYRYADYLSAKKEYFKWKSSLMADFKKSGDRSLLGQILDKYNVIQNLSTEFDRFHNTTLKSLATPHTLTFFKNFVEHEMAVSNFIAFAKFTQLKIVGSDKTISLFDAYELDSNGDLKLKAGVILDNKLDGALSNKFNAINYFIQGNYNKLDKTIAEKHAFGKLVFFMRNYMVPMLTQRFHPQRYNHQLGFIQEGYYLTFIKAMWTDLKNLQLNIFANYKNWTPAEQQAAFRIIKEMGALLLMTLLLILMGYDPKKKKPVEGESLANGTWWLNQATFVIAKLQMEIKTFTPTPAGIKALYQTAKEWTVMNNYVGDLLDVVKYLGLTIAGDDAAYYKNTVNPNIPWKEEGDSKLVAKALSLIGITGTQIAPSQALKNLEYSKVSR